MKVSDGLCHGLSRIRKGWLCAESREGRAYAALSVQEAFPQTIRRRNAEGRVAAAHCLSRVAQADDEREERPEHARTRSQASEPVGSTNAERASAAIVALLAVVAENAPAPTLAMFAVVGVAAQLAVQDQRAGRLAGRARRDLECMVGAQEIRLGTIEPRQRQAQRQGLRSGKRAGLYRRPRNLPRSKCERIRFRQRGRRGLRGSVNERRRGQQRLGRFPNSGCNNN